MEESRQNGKRPPDVAAPVQKAAPDSSKTERPAPDKPTPAKAQQQPVRAVPSPGARPQEAGARQTPPEAGTPSNPAIRPPATAARARRRHVLLLLSFVLWVLTPLGVGTAYLYTTALDQYASHVGFSVRKEEVGSAIELLGGITQLSGASSSDTDILYEFIQSQQMVRAINDKFDLREIYVRPEDPVFSLGEDVRIEALADYWQRMVKVFYDSGSGLIEIRVLAFTPENAQAIATAVFDESSEMINELSAIARADATRYAKEELENEQTRLKTARQALTAFRSRTRIVDPTVDIQGQMGLLNSLQATLADAIIERELLLESSSATDPRVLQARKKIQVIEAQIDKERGLFGGSSDDSPNDDYSRLLEEYEVLSVNREFAEKSYLSAQATYDSALAEAQRKSRYLAKHIEPTLAETAEYPRRAMLVALIGIFLVISWAILAISYYSFRDRR